MNSATLEKQLQRLADALSEFDDALIDTQMNSVPSPNTRDICRRRLLAEINRDLPDIGGSVCGIGGKLSNSRLLRGDTKPRTVQKAYSQNGVRQKARGSGYSTK